MRPFAPGRELAPGVRARRHLGRSRFFDLYEAWCERRACPVVVKALRPDRRAERGARAALLREGRLLRRLAHPNLVRAYEVHAGPRPAVVLETVGGETLAHLVERLRRRLGAREVGHLGLHLCAALSYLHGEGIVHLDLKPANVVAEAGRAKLLDLSIARRPGPVPPGRGTWCNMAPEQARGGEVGPPADVWGLGTVLYEAAAGVNPFEEWEELDRPTLAHRAAPLRAHRRLPAGAGALVDACLEPDPGDRPALAELRAGLAGLASGRSSA